jgi:hypothetical protein
MSASSPVRKTPAFGLIGALKMEKKQKHLEFLQTAIGRMAGNLFLLKGWSDRADRVETALRTPMRKQRGGTR